MEEEAECPVCLTSYDVVSCVPRVIPCGHTFCQGCLLLLPHPFLHTIKCPSCNQLVNFPKHPSLFPKNIDLLRFSSSKNPKQTILNKDNNNGTNIINDDEFGICSVLDLWSPEFYHYWIRWLLPNDTISIHQTKNHQFQLHTGIVLKSSGSCSKSLFAGLLQHDYQVRLLKLGELNREQTTCFKYHSDAKVINFLYVMDNIRRDEVRLLLDASLRVRRVGRLYGFWGDDSVFLVCEGFGSSLVDKVLCERPGLKEMVCYVMMIGVEMCEIVYGLHLQGLVVGCLSGCCFGFNEFDRGYFDLGNAVSMGRRIQRVVSHSISDQVGMEGEDFGLRECVVNYGVFASPELLAKMMGKKGVEELETLNFDVCYGSDVWSLACLVLWLLTGKSFVEEMYSYYSHILFHESSDGNEAWLPLYMGWKEKVTALLDRTLDTEFDLLKKMLCKCLEFHPVNRPSLNNLWICMKEHINKSGIDVTNSLRLGVAPENIKHCIVLGELCQLDKEMENCTTKTSDVSEGHVDVISSVEHEGNSITDKDIGESVSKGEVKSIDLKGHIDCITALTVGGGFLFSSSYDKIVNIWSLQDFTHVLSLKGHEHRVMAVVYVDETSLCISGDNGGAICIWNASVPLDTEPIKRLNEDKDWRYSGIHAMAVSGTQYLYTGSGDKTVKAWALQDYTLMCVMSGHKSVVSSLVVNSGVLYSGSWDGTVRLWSTSDHSSLAVIGEDSPSNISAVLALAAEHSLLFVTHEDGQVKIWQNDRLLITKKAHNGAIFTVLKKERWLFSGGWDKTISVQEFSGDGAKSDISLVGYIPSKSAITALAYWQGKLFVGQADKIIKVYYSIV